MNGPVYGAIDDSGIIVSALLSGRKTEVILAVSSLASSPTALISLSYFVKTHRYPHVDKRATPKVQQQREQIMWTVCYTGCTSVFGFVGLQSDTAGPFGMNKAENPNTAGIQPLVKKSQKRSRAVYRLLIASAALLLMMGCAHNSVPEEAAAASSTSDPEVETKRPPDPRYDLPAADKRALTIFLDSQSFEYVEDERVLINGPVSSGAVEHPTPIGKFQVLSKQRDKRSGSYTNYFDQPTPMPYALQFRGPYYVHEGYLPGRAASHGCVRLDYEDARLLYSRIRVGDPVQVVRGGGQAEAQDPVSGLPLVF